MNTITVVCGNNVTKTTIEGVPATTTLRAVLERAHVDYTKATMTLDGMALSIGQLDRSFADLGITTKCYLLGVEKRVNA